MSEIDKTIEELEQEVLDDLNEAEHGMKKDTSAPAKAGGKPDPMKKVDGEVQDTGPAVVKGDAPKKDLAKSAKKDSSIPVKTKGDEKPMKMKEDSTGYTDEEIRDLCHSKDHDCATVVEHPVWGKGKPVHGSHALPTDDGYVEWYDVQFKHGIEEKVMAEDMKVTVSEAHHKEGMHPEKMTKEKLHAAMHGMMKKMNKETLVATYKAMEGGHEPTEEQLELDGLNKAKAAIEKRLSSINVKEDVDALVQGEELSEEFQKKAATIFEAAVKSKVRSEIERIEEEKTQEVSSEVETFKTELAEKVDGYLDYVVKEWMTENELAIERGLKGEIAEDFIGGLKALFEEHYIDVPDEKYDILESQASKIDELENKLNETIGKLTEKNKSENELVREAVINEVSSDLAETQSEKFAELIKDVDFTDKESFTDKLNTLKENYFPKSTPQNLTEEGGSEEKEIEASGVMAAYTSAIKRQTSYAPFNNVKK
tara:strand:- start:529 stop:1974 length:1446 start_codon:yes stop_codon:yes gene_type:complete